MGGGHRCGRCRSDLSLWFVVLVVVLVVPIINIIISDRIGDPFGSARNLLWIVSEWIRVNGRNWSEFGSESSHILMVSPDLPFSEWFRAVLSSRRLKVRGSACTKSDHGEQAAQDGIASSTSSGFKGTEGAFLAHRYMELLQCRFIFRYCGHVPVHFWGLLSNE